MVSSGGDFNSDDIIWRSSGELVLSSQALFKQADLRSQISMANQIYLLGIQTPSKSKSKSTIIL